MEEIKCPKCGEVFKVDESGYAAILKQVRDNEFDKELKSREDHYAADKENAVLLAKEQAKNDLNAALRDKDAVIQSLEHQLEQLKAEYQHTMDATRLDKDQEIVVLKNRLEQADMQRRLAVTEAVAEKDRALAEKEQAIALLKGDINTKEKEKQLSEKSLRESFEAQLRLKDETIAQYKDFKARQSTKMVGESLEQHCLTEFNKLRATGFRNAYFEKDNDARSGSKGDFIYRENAEDGTEFISIMFEMKNEADETATKHKNEDFLRELDKDRQEKHCEYAVLVSLLEAENEFYNTGIVDMSHRYPKMYVIRPQFFIPMITLLRNAALNSLEYKQELAVIRSQNIDITHFEDEVNDFKTKFAYNYNQASKRFQEAIDEIDKSITHLQKIRDALTASDRQLRLANDKAEDLTIKRLTRNNPTMAARFAALQDEK